MLLLVTAKARGSREDNGREMDKNNACKHYHQAGELAQSVKQARGPEFDAQHSSMVVHTCNPSPGDMQIPGVHRPVSQAESGNFRSSRRD